MHVVYTNIHTNVYLYTYIPVVYIYMLYIYKIYTIYYVYYI